MSELYDDLPDWAKQEREPYWRKKALEDARLKQSIDYGVRQNPDASAKEQANAKKLDLPASFVKENATEVDAIARAKDVDRATTESPSVRQLLANPDTAAIIHDDVEELSLLEKTAQTFSALGGSIAVGAGGLSRGILRYPEMFGRFGDFLTDLPGISHVNKMLGMYELGEELGINPEGTFVEAIQDGIEIGGTIYGPTQAAERNAEISARLYPEIQKYNEVADQAFEDALEGDLTGIGQVLTDPRALAAFVGQAIPSLAVMVMTGGSLTAIAAMEAMEVTEDIGEFEKMTGTRVDPNQYMAAMAQVATLNTVFEKFGFSKIVGSKGVLSTFLAGVSEMGTEMAQAFNTNLSIWWAYNKDKNLTGGVLSGGLGGFGAGLGGGALSSLGQAADSESRHSQDLRRAAGALTSADGLQQIVAAYEETKTKDRSKDVAKQTIKEAVGTEAQVVIPYTEANALFQENPEVRNDLSEDADEVVSEALATEQDVVLPVEEYVIALSEHHDKLADVVRNDMDGMNRAEAEEWLSQDQNQKIFDRADAILQEAENEAGFVESASRVGKSVEKQILKTGKRTKSQAGVEAKLHEAFAITVADTLNKEAIAKGDEAVNTPESVYENFGLKITAAPVEGEQLAQTTSLEDIKMPEIEMTTADGEIVGVKFTAQQAMDTVNSKTEALQKLQACING
jgi:hypothetical protein